MRSRQINNLLAAGAIAIGVAAIGIALAGLLMPIDSGADDVAHPFQAKAITAPATQPAGMDRLFARAFRTSLDSDGPAATASKVAAAASPAAATAQMQISVAGTIGSSIALLRLADGSIVARGLGETIDNAQIVRIDPAQVVFRRNGAEFTIAKLPTSDPSAGMIVAR